MYENCEYWNELTDRCELRKHLDAIGLEPIMPIERPPDKHIQEFCTTKKAKDCWKRKIVYQMVDDSIFIEDFPEYMSIRHVLWKWLKYGTLLSVICFTVFILGILLIYATGGGLYFF